MTIYLVIERPEMGHMSLCGPHDNLKAACSNMKAVGLILSDLSIENGHIHIEKHECEDAEVGKPIFVLFRHPEPNAPFFDERSQVEKLQINQFSQDEQTSKCDMAYSLESVKCVVK